MIKARFTIILILSFQVMVYAQKNVTEVTKSTLTGISLPAGSKQDKRILSTASAKTLLEMKATEIGRTVSGSAEVVTLPVASPGIQAERVKKLLNESGYKIDEVQGDSKYSVISKDLSSYIIYLDESKSGTEFYTVSILADPKAATDTKTQNKSAVVNETVSSPATTTNAHKSDIIPLTAAAAASNAVSKTEAEKVIVKEALPSSGQGGFKFTSTNFDDGWIATTADEFVLITKDRVNVRLYYTVEITEQMRPPVMEVHDYFWNLLVVPSFNVIRLWKWEEPITYFRNYYIYAEAVERSTGKNCYIGLNVVTGSGGASPVLAIAPDKATYDSQFPHPDNLKKMLGYNRFAVSHSDLYGTWGESGSTAANYYNSYTGAYAGMAFASSANTFIFGTSGDYSSKHSGASGMVGTMTTYNQEYKGKATVTNWEIILTNRWKEKTETFEAWFEQVRGGRVLHLIDKAARGITYDLVKER